ncbi:ABC transporter permease [Micromonospora craniellae]|uniref:ABC transporter permease n=2 Tax=Micromonospora craniellae TaxID=2294034 RepID=A0A372G586_9ACTN|nr:FtsX-like permease family protein [Micromonospora craniellae]RFS47936.1 ABC transporter permease [Micromonospora craniellae]
MRARGRTALVLAMIVLPVLALSFIAVSADMANLTSAEEMDRRLGDADAELRMISQGPVTQDADGSGWTGSDDRVPEAVTVDAIARLLPTDSRILPVRRWVPLHVRDGSRVRDDVLATAADLTDPLAAGLVRIHQGRVPATADEIAVNRAARRTLGAGIGDVLTAGDGTQNWTVVGVIEMPEALEPKMFLHPDGVPSGPRSHDTVFLVDLPGPVTKDLFRHLNRNGVVVGARTSAPPTALDVAGPFSGSLGPEAIGTGLLAGGLGLLEVVLLVGPAFAVGVRRRRRELALVAVAGGDAAQLRRVVLADGVLLGCVGAAAGLALGVLSAFAARPLVEEFVFQHRFAGYRVWPAALGVIALVAVLAGVLAALAPAWTAARQDVVAGLAGRRGATTHRRRWLTLGVLLAVGGAVVAGFGAAMVSPVVILGGLVLGELGLVFATPTLVGLLARLGRFLPLAPRIAVRDASRNRSSAAPAISAVMASVAASVALGAFLASDDIRTDQQYRPLLPDRTVLVTADDPEGAGPPDEAAITGTAREHLGAGAIAPLATAGCRTTFEACLVSAVPPPAQICPWRPYPPITEADQQRARADQRCQGPAEDHLDGYLQVAVDDGAALPMLTGATPAEVAAATAVLRAGGAVVTDPRYLGDGRLHLQVEHGEPTRTKEAIVPGYAVRSDLRPPWLVLSPAAADRLDLAVRQTGWAIEADEPPGQRQRDRFVEAVESIGPVGTQFEVGKGFGGAEPLLLLLAGVSAVVTVGAAGIATGLAAAEGRADLSTLASVGAGPGVRKLLSLCQAGVIAVLGSLLGIVAGLCSALIILTFTNRRLTEGWPVEPPYPLVMPWLTLGVLVVVPLVAMAGAALLTRSRLPVERRLD